MMNVLYEEEGELKVGAVLGQSPASFQVESPHGRRSKIKAANVVLNFEQPSGAELLAEARKFADGLDTDFLWECRKGAEFGFQDLARDYVGRDPGPVESAGILLKLQSAPMYFYRRGKGRFQAAPEETLRLALASLEKKKRVQEQIDAWAAALATFSCPPEVARLKDELLYQPDRNKPETKALEQACAKTGLNPARLLEKCGLLSDSHAYHLGRFIHEYFPKGTEAPETSLPADLAATIEALPLAPAPAFSLDDIGTTEVDDAFSVVRVSDSEWRVGIHIAAPAVGISPGSPLDGVARHRLSTAYMPGQKFTMLPSSAISAFSLDEGTERPALSLYLNVSADGFKVLGRHTKIERLRIAANLRHAHHDALNEAFLRGREGAAASGLPFAEELHLLWQLAEALERERGKPSVSLTHVDYNFRVEGDRIHIEPRKRGAPLDKAVSELMIQTNTSWGGFLAERDVAALYRVQTSGKVRMSVHAEVHEGLGVTGYAWMTSPLRRYVDLLNQWQLVSAVKGERPPFNRNSEGLLASLRAFEVTAAGYDEHQRAMEHYWCLRWLVQEGVTHTEATVVRENLVRFERIPLVTRAGGLPDLPMGTRVRVGVEGVDLLDRTLQCHWRETLAEAAAEAPNKA